MIGLVTYTIVLF